MKLQGKSPKIINFRFFQKYLAQMNPGGRAGHWKMNNFEIGKKVVLQSFPKCQLRNYRGKIEKTILEFSKHI